MNAADNFMVAADNVSSLIPEFFAGLLLVASVGIAFVVAIKFIKRIFKAS